MAVIKLAGEDSMIEITPWSDHGYLFKSLEFHESIGGEISSGTLVLTSDGTEIEFMNSQDNVEIKFKQLKAWREKLVEYKMTAYIYDRTILENEVTLNIVPYENKDFSTLPRVAKHKDTIRKIIESLFTGDKKFLDVDDKDLTPDISSVLDSIDQTSMTDYDLCNRLCRSYRKDSVYSFGMEGLRIKSIFREPIVIYGDSDCASLDTKDISYYKENEFESKSMEKSVNLAPRMYGNDYIITRNDFHSDLLDIYQYNIIRTVSKSKLQLKFIHRIPEFKIGDIVLYIDKLKFNKGRKYICTDLTVRISFNDIEFDCCLKGWEDAIV